MLYMYIYEQINHVYSSFFICTLAFRILFLYVWLVM